MPPPPPRTGRWAAVALAIGVGAVTAGVLVRERPQPIPVIAPRPLPAGPEQPIAYYLARADIERGERYFARCAACHTINEGGPHGVGPNLWGVMGAPIGSREDYAFSPALRTGGGSWEWEAMNAFLRSPRTFRPGTRMTFAGVSDPQERADLMFYMNRQGGTLTPPPVGR